MSAKEPSQEPSSELTVEKEREPMPEVFRDPNGLDIFHHAPAETKHVYQETFEQEQQLSGSGIVNCCATRQ